MTFIHVKVDMDGGRGNLLEDARRRPEPFVRER